jgi:hypothetical protein
MHQIPSFDIESAMIRRQKNWERTSKTARWNGLIMMIGSFPLFLIGLAQAEGTWEILGATGFFAAFFGFGYMAYRIGLSDGKQ